MENMKKFIKNNWYYILIYIVFFVLCILFPYTGDDWAWGAQEGVERLKTFFSNYNGRYGGNLLVMLITRSVCIRAILESLSFTYLIYLINRIINKENKKIGILVIFLLSIMPIDILRQSVVWASGYANYVPPIIFSLMFINRNTYLFKDKIKDERKNSVWALLLFALIGFVGALFIENITIYVCIVALFTCIYEFVKTKKVKFHNIGYLIGSVAGAICMFTNGAYHAISNGGDQYRAIEQGNIIIRCLKTYLKELDRHIFYHNFILTLILAIIILYFLYKIIKTNKKKVVKIFAYISVFCTFLYITNLIFMQFFTSPFVSRLLINTLNAGITFIFTFALCFIFIYGIKKMETKKKLFFYLGTIILSNLPLLVVTPIGPRLFLSNYIFFTMIIIELLEEIKLKEDTMYHFIQIGTICTLGFLATVFVQINHVQKVTEKYITEHQSEKEEITLPALPFAYYLHCANPDKDTNTLYNTRYKVFYEIDENVTLTFEKYQKWQKHQK